MFASSHPRSFVSTKMETRWWWAEGDKIRTSSSEVTLTAQAASPDAALSDGVAPTELEAKATVRRFLEHYLSYTPDSAPRNLAESLNMMTTNLRTFR